MMYNFLNVIEGRINRNNGSRVSTNVFKGQIIKLFD